MSATHENFYYEIFINQEILVLRNFCTIKVWHYTVAIMSHKVVSYKVIISTVIVYVYTIDPDSTKDEEPSVAAVNKKPLIGSQLSDPALLDGPPEQVCNVCMFVCMHVRICV